MSDEQKELIKKDIRDLIDLHFDKHVAYNQVKIEILLSIIKDLAYEIPC